MSTITSCKKPKYTRDFFLREYPDLQFVNENGNIQSERSFIRFSSRNGGQFFNVINPDLILVRKRDQEPYTGYIRTFVFYTINLEAVFEEGEIKRLRFWHSNRQLGMNANYEAGSGSAWGRNGNNLISWTPDETIYYYGDIQTVKTIFTDTMTSHYNREGELDNYQIETDSTFEDYYPNGQIKSRTFKNWEGPIRRWHQNGSIKVEGYIEDGEYVGIWKEYDSLGNVINTKNWDEEQDEVKKINRRN